MDIRDGMVRDIVEKQIITYLFTTKYLEFEDKPAKCMHDEIRLELDGKHNINVTVEYVEKILDNLIEKHYVDVTFNDTNYKEKGKLELTLPGRHYGFEKNYFTPEDITFFVDSKYKEQLDTSVEIYKNILKMNENMKKQNLAVTEKVTEQEKQINSFNSNLLTIMGILISAFAIIGFNIGGIKFIISERETLKIWEYVAGIAVINLSIVYSLYFLFYLINVIVNPKDGENVKNKLCIFDKKTATIMFFVIVVAVIVCFVIALKK